MRYYVDDSRASVYGTWWPVFCAFVYTQKFMDLNCKQKSPRKHWDPYRTICWNEYSVSTERFECGHSSSSSCCYCCHWCSWFLFNCFNRIVYSHLEWWGVCECASVCLRICLWSTHYIGRGATRRDATRPFDMYVCVLVLIILMNAPNEREHDLFCVADWWSRLLMLIQCGSHSHTAPSQS